MLTGIDVNIAVRKYQYQEAKLFYSKQTRFYYLKNIETGELI